MSPFSVPDYPQNPYSPFFSPPLFQCASGCKVTFSPVSSVIYLGCYLFPTRHPQRETLLPGLDVSAKPPSSLLVGFLIDALRLTGSRISPLFSFNGVLCHARSCVRLFPSSSLSCFSLGFPAGQICRNFNSLLRCPHLISSG